MWRIYGRKGFLTLFIVLLLTGCQRASLQDGMAQGGGGTVVAGNESSVETGLPMDTGSSTEAEQANSTETDGSIPGTGENIPSVEPSDESRKVPIVIYELPDDIFQLPVTSIPYYNKGKITFLSDNDLKQHEKSQSRLQTGIDVVTALTSNLAGQEDANLEWVDTAPHERTTSDGVVMKEVTDERVDLFVPGIGRYEIELRSPPDNKVLYISKITLHLDRATATDERAISAKPRSVNPIVLYELPDEVFQLPRTSIPYYDGGKIRFIPEIVFKQHEEGHQPWLDAGIDVVSTKTSNLPGQENPYRELDDSSSIKRTTPSGIVIKKVTNEFIQLIVPDIGKYEIELTAPDPPKTIILFISKITLHLNKSP